MINGWGLVDNFNKAWNSGGDALHVFNTSDSLLGVTAGAAQITEAAISASVVHRLGKEAVEKALPILGLRVITAGAGAASGFAVLIGQMIKAKRALEHGDFGAFTAYSLSSASVLGLATTNTVIFIGAFSDFMIAKGSQRAIWFAVSRAVAGTEARLAAATIAGLEVWGLIFLAAGLIFEIGAFVLTPDALQDHVRRTYFGIGPENYKTLAEEVDAVEKLNHSTSNTSPAINNSPASISELGAMP